MDNLELWYRANRGKSADGVPPISFKSNGDALTNWTIYGHTSPNLFDASSIVPDSSIDFQTGEIVESDGTSVSDWIPISDTGLFFSGMLTSSDPSASLVIFALYDGEKNLLDIQATGWNESGAKSHEITVVEGTAFMRLQLTDNIYQNVMINQGDSALPYEAFGAVGERTENLFNKDGDNYGYFASTTGIYTLNPQYRYFRIPVTQGDVVNMSSIGRGRGCTFYKGNWVSAVTTASYTVPDGVDEVANNYIVTSWGSAMVTINTPLPTEYVPYGYKIPITCGGETTNIYIGDTPLGTGQTVTGSETGVAIPTIAGQNTFSVNTTMQPPKVTVSAAKGMTESLMKYLEFKYGVLKMAGVQTGIFEILGTLPLSFTANGEPLRDWVIYGADGGVGDRTENLLSIEYFLNNMESSSLNANTKYIELHLLPNTFYCLSSNFYDAVTSSWFITLPNAAPSSLSNGVNSDRRFATVETGDDGKLWIWGRTKRAMPSGIGIPITEMTAIDYVMLNRGSTPIPYEPYGYKIPVTCNNETSILYLNEPLESGDSISFSDTGVEIPTIEGRNTLTVDTDVQPPEIKIKFKQ